MYDMVRGQLLMLGSKNVLCKFQIKFGVAATLIWCPNIDRTFIYFMPDTYLIVYRNEEIAGKPAEKGVNEMVRKRWDSLKWAKSAIGKRVVSFSQANFGYSIMPAVDQCLAMIQRLILNSNECGTTDNEYETEHDAGLCVAVHSNKWSHQYTTELQCSLCSNGKLK